LLVHRGYEHSRDFVSASRGRAGAAGIGRVRYNSLQHGHALLIGNSHYRDRHWPQLDDVPLQLDALRRGLRGHFDTVDVASDLETEKLRQTITGFLQTYGNDDNARLFIYYAGHGYTELIPERDENRGRHAVDQWNPAGL
jgi:hypothetical protein